MHAVSKIVNVVNTEGSMQWVQYLKRYAISTIV